MLAKILKSPKITSILITQSNFPGTQNLENTFSGFLLFLRDLGGQHSQQQNPDLTPRQVPWAPGASQGTQASRPGAAPPECCLCPYELRTQGCPVAALGTHDSQHTSSKLPNLRDVQAATGRHVAWPTQASISWRSLQTLGQRHGDTGRAIRADPNLGSPSESRHRRELPVPKPPGLMKDHELNPEERGRDTLRLSSFPILTQMLFYKNKIWKRQQYQPRRE